MSSGTGALRSDGSRSFFIVVFSEAVRLNSSLCCVYNQSKAFQWRMTPRLNIICFVTNSCRHVNNNCERGAFGIRIKNCPTIGNLNFFFHRLFIGGNCINSCTAAFKNILCFGNANLQVFVNIEEVAVSIFSSLFVVWISGHFIL